MKPRTVVSMEQALSLTYATLRFVHLGWRVIRVEATAEGGNKHPGDPNRYIGSQVADEDRRSYYIAPNVGKEAISLNLKTPEGQEALQRIIRELDADVFCCNTVPVRYQQLGIDYDTLRAVKPDLIWAAISAMGPEYPNVPGYDPVIQAMVGYMDVTGFADGPPTLAGVPLVDLKAGDEVYANVLMALLERAESGQGRRIDVSMLQAAASWLITLLPLVDMKCGPEEITRWGNAHRKFIPTNVYPTKDGFIYLALGSNVQWKRLTALEKFASLSHSGRRDTAEVRYQEREDIYRELGAITAQYDRDEVEPDLAAAKIPQAAIQTIDQVRAMEAISSKVTRTTLPDGQSIGMQPMAVDIETPTMEYGFSPRHGEHTDAVLQEVGYSADDCARLREQGVIN